MTTALREDELLREVRLPILPKGTYAGFAEYSRRAGDYAIAMAVSDLPAEERRHERHARRRRRRGSQRRAASPRPSAR